MHKISVLFICIHNSARSQMAEALLQSIGGDRFDAESAGISPGKLNPFAVKAMAGMGIDISSRTTDRADDKARSGKKYDYVITVCDGSAAEQCPVFPGGGKKLHWNFPDPSALKGTDDEKLAGTVRIRDMIRTRIEEWVKAVKS